MRYTQDFLLDENSMKAYLLRSGEEWKLDRKDESLCSMFYLICKQRGSQALWLPVTGTLTTLDCFEPEKNLPYEDWLRQARMVTQKIA